MLTIKGVKHGSLWHIHAALTQPDGQVRMVMGVGTNLEEVTSRLELDLSCQNTEAVFNHPEHEKALKALAGDA